MKKYIAILLLSFLVIQIFISCQKNCESNLLGSVRFSQTDLNIIPYQGNEQLIYISSSGSQIIFNGGNRVSHYGTDGDQWVEFPGSDDYCPGNFYYTERNGIKFYATVSGSWMGFEMGMTDPFNNPVKKYFGISVTVLDSIYWYFGSSYRFDSLNLYDVKPPYEIICANDSVLIGSKVFYNVYVFQTGSDYHYPTVGNLKTVFYSLSQGIVGFQNENGKTWHLQ